MGAVPESDLVGEWNMKVLISGSSGLIGTVLVRRLESSGHSVTRLVRPGSASASDTIPWDPATGMLDARQLEGFDAAIHLSGENVASRRWSSEQKARIRDSRVQSTALLANAFAGLDSPPRSLRLRLGHRLLWGQGR